MVRTFIIYEQRERERELNHFSDKIDPRDGIFTYTDPNTNDILLESVETGKTEIFVEARNLVSFSLIV